MTHPAVSVVIATHNRPARLRRAIESVLSQTFDDFELIVVDDASRQSQEEHVLAVADTRISFVRHQTNRGASAARNSGLRQARGVYVGFLDDDDEWLPRKLEIQLAKFRESTDRVGGIYAGFVKVLERTGEVILTANPRPLLRGPVDFLESTRFGTSVPLLRRACFDSVGTFDESLPGTQDRDMWIRIARRFSFDFVPDTLVRQYIHGDQITSDLPRKIDARERILAKYREDLESHPDLMVRHLWRLGLLCCCNAEHRRGRRYLRQAILRKPMLRDAYRDLFQSLLVPRAMERRLMEQVFSGADGIPFYY